MLKFMILSPPRRASDDENRGRNNKSKRGWEEKE